MRNRLKEAWGCDLRTLALFRVMLAFVILGDLITRSCHLQAHYSDLGILPRRDLLASGAGWQPSLHLISGSTTIQAVLFLIAAIVAIALLIGYHTRLATFLSWVMLISLHHRNDVVTQGGDQLMRVLLFWGMFLPLAGRFSVDSALEKENRTEPNLYFSAATLGLLVQVMCVYFFTALLKIDPVWMVDRTAVQYAVNIEHLVTPIGALLKQTPLLDQGLTFFVWHIELIGPFLMLAPILSPWMRSGVLFLLVMMHVGFLLCLRVGFFPFVSITSLTTFTPSVLWDRLGAWLRTPERIGIKIFYDQDCAFCHKMCLILREFLLFKEISMAPAQAHPHMFSLMQQHHSWVVQDHRGVSHVRFSALVLLFKQSPIFHPIGRLMGITMLQGLGDRFYQWVADHRGQLGRLSAIWLPFRRPFWRPSLVSQMIIGLLVVAVLWVNIGTVKGCEHLIPVYVRQLARSLELQQAWNMFAPKPMSVEGWYVARGEGSNAEVVEVIRGEVGEPTWRRPKQLLPPGQDTDRWRKYYDWLWMDNYKSYRTPYAQFLCREWQRQHPTGVKLARLTLYLMREDVTISGEPRRPERVILHQHECAPVGQTHSGSAGSVPR